MQQGRCATSAPMPDRVSSASSPVSRAQIVEEHRAARAQAVEHLARVRRQLVVAGLGGRCPASRRATATPRCARAGRARPASPASAAAVRSSSAGRGDRRAQATSPVRQRRSSSRRLVAVDSRRQHRALPRGASQLESVQERQRFAQPVESRQPIARVDVLPLEQEAHEVGRADRLDLGAQPVDGVAVDARQQRAGRTIPSADRCGIAAA